LDNSATRISRASNSGGTHLPFLDGLRGLAALYVVFGHAYQTYYVEVSKGYRPVDYWVFDFFGAGKAAVALFIVLSGFCLMMPVAKSSDGQLRGGFSRYIKRRAWRILPPYYAAMGLSLLLIGVLPAMQRTDGKFLSMALPAMKVDVIVSHLLMVYNLHATWVYKINPPFWSVGTEWQIYFLFPLILLPLWRRWGAAAAIGAGLVAGLAPHWLLARTSYSISECHPWLSGLFPMGMAAAGACFVEEERRGAALNFLWRWAGTIAVGFIVLSFALGLSTHWYGHKHVPFDVMAGLAAMGLLVWCYKGREKRAGKSTFVALLESGPVAFLGAISYSLYLMHVPVLFLVHRWTEPWHRSAGQVVLIMVLGGVPLAVVCCWLFHLAFERPFLNSGPRKVRASEAAAPLELVAAAGVTATS